jgi:PAS domain S-box-containing protein
MSQENDRTITADSDGVIRHWGREAENVFGYTSGEALGRKVDLIIPPVLRTRHWRGFNKAIETGRLRRRDPTLKLPAVHKNGEIIPFGGLSPSHTPMTERWTEPWRPSSGEDPPGRRRPGGPFSLHSNWGNGYVEEHSVASPPGLRAASARTEAGPAPTATRSATHGRWR